MRRTFAVAATVAAIALLPLVMVACGQPASESSGPPTGPTPTGQVDGGQWGQRAALIEANSELALAELNGVSRD